MMDWHIVIDILESWFGGDFIYPLVELDEKKKKSLQEKVEKIMKTIGDEDLKLFKRMFEETAMKILIEKNNIDDVDEKFIFLNKFLNVKNVESAIQQKREQLEQINSEIKNRNNNDKRSSPPKSETQPKMPSPKSPTPKKKAESRSPKSPRARSRSRSRSKSQTQRAEPKTPQKLKSQTQRAKSKTPPKPKSPTPKKNTSASLRERLTPKQQQKTTQKKPAQKSKKRKSFNDGDEFSDDTGRYTIVQMKGDGNCQFHAIATGLRMLDPVRYPNINHTQVRRDIVEYLTNHRDEFVNGQQLNQNRDYDTHVGVDLDDIKVIEKDRDYKRLYKLQYEQIQDMIENDTDREVINNAIFDLFVKYIAKNGKWGLSATLFAASRRYGKCFHSHYANVENYVEEFDHYNKQICNGNRDNAIHLLYVGDTHYDFLIPYNQN